MSATIYWRPIARRSGYIETDTPSAMMVAIRNGFGRELPARFSGEDIPTLKNILMIQEHEQQRKPWRQLITEIEKNGAIELWAEY